MKKEVDQQIKFLHERAKALIKQELDENEIRTELEKEGITRDYAGMIIQNVLNDIRDRKDSWKLLIMGLFFIVAGLLINFFSYVIAENANSSFFYLFWGIVVTGIILVYKAILLYKK